MNKNKILSSDLLDIIFDGRNKAYGAYDLRKTYQQRVLYALLGTVGISFLFFMLMFSGHIKEPLKKQVYVSDFFLQPHLPDLIKPFKILPPPARKAVSSTFKTISNTTPVIVQNNLATKTPPEVREYDGARISNITQSGIDAGDNKVIATGQNNTGYNTGVSTTKQGDDGGEFKQVEVEAQFQGGIAAWMRYLERHLNNNLPSEAGAPAGRYTVYVSFLVDKNGNLSEVVAENNPDYGTAEEAVRVIKNGPKWKPAIQNGHNVAYRVRQAITFVVGDNG